MINRLVILAAISFGFAAALSAAPQLSLSTTSLGPIQITPGSNGTSQVVLAQNIGTGSLSLSAGASASWLAPTIGAARSCGSSGGTCYPITIALNTSSLAAGAYTGYVLVTDPNAIDSPQSIAVSINIGANIPSAVTFYVTPRGGPNPTASLRINAPGNVSGTATTQSGGNWLSLISNAPFGTGYSIMGVAQAGQTAGTYTGSLALSGASTQTVNVTLIVTNSPIITPVTTPVLLSGSGNNASATVMFATTGSGTLNITGATATSSDANLLSAAVNSGGTSITIKATPGATLAPGLYSGSVTITSNAANNSQISVPVVYQAEAAGTPLIFSGGVTNIGNFVSGNAAPGEILAVFGDQLAPAGTIAQNPGLPPLATTLGTVQVLVNNVPAPLYFVSPGQVNFQLPYEVPVGQMATVQVVSNGTNGNLRPLNVVASAPAELIWPASVIPGGYAIAVNTDYSLVLPSPVPGFTTHPAKAGDTLTIYCAGFGQTSPPAVTGAAASSTNLAEIQNVTVTFGGFFTGSAITVPAAFAGLTPTAVGLYQVNVTIPPGLDPSNALPVVLNLNGVSSNMGLIAVSQ